MKLTPNQEAVVTTRDKNILVSAAAGSGKTAVLVERIISQIFDDRHPVDVDRILVVTFTKAAAKEMKERIYQAIEKKAQEESLNSHLMKQMNLVNSAFISTIDSFCGYIVRNYFEEIHLDPNFRIAEESELAIQRADIMAELFEEKFAEGNKEFIQFIDAYSPKHDLSKISEMIYQLYLDAASKPWIRDYLNGLLHIYNITSVDELEQSDWMKEIMLYIRKLLSDIQNEYITMMEQISPEHKYFEVFMSELSLVNGYLSCQNFDDLVDKMASIEQDIGRLPSKKSALNEEETDQYYKEIRTLLTKKLKEIQQQYLSMKLEQIYESMIAIKPFAQEFVTITIEFMERYQKKKSELNVLDFSDLEHFALNILVDEDSKQKSAVAVELSEYFEAVMVDEYQDSNMLQETILSSITTNDDNYGNYFMVGDMKQSIYRFRSADPGIFAAKYLLYQKEVENNIRIDLDKNFRSRKEVIDSVNLVFQNIMHKDFGGIEYDKAASLDYGAIDYELLEDSVSRKTELILIDKDVTKNEDVEENAKQLEAKYVAQKIASMMETYFVTDKETKQLRPLMYKDIVILHRSANTEGSVFMDYLNELFIPAFLVSKTQYFDSIEIELMVALLTIIDNPRDDISFTAVLKSPMFQIEDSLLLAIRNEFSTESFYRAVFLYAQNHPEEKKLDDFILFYKKMRQISVEEPIHVLLQKIYQSTGYLDYVTALPNGQVRRNRLDKMVDMAISYESTSYKGLFRFLHYLKRMKKYNIDVSAGSVLGEDENVVRIMTVHKSKGLEFPVVFLVGSSHDFNNSDRKNSFLTLPHLGLFMQEMDAVHRVEYLSTPIEFARELVHMEGVAEEERNLYVAMTRAKEKLIITGSMTKLEEKLEKSTRDMNPFSFSKRVSAHNFLEWLLPVAVKYPQIFDIEVIQLDNYIHQDIHLEIFQKQKKDILLSAVASYSEQDDLYFEVDERMSYVYPYATDQIYKNKYSVSEIKHQKMEELLDNDEKPLFLEKQKEPIVPEFCKTTHVENAGALYGSAMHRFLECFDFTKNDSMQHQMNTELSRMIERGLLEEKDAKRLNLKALQTFLSCNLANRMCDAAQKGRLYLEKAFVMNTSPSAMFGVNQEEEQLKMDESHQIIVQGIIDVFFEEDGKIILMDYKTDHVKDKNELLKRYQVQLLLYARAIEQARRLPVTEIYLYSFHLNQAILVSREEIV